MVTGHENIWLILPVGLPCFVCTGATQCLPYLVIRHKMYGQLPPSRSVKLPGLPSNMLSQTASHETTERYLFGSCK